MNKRIKNQIPSQQELRLRLEEAQNTLLQRNEELAAAERLAHTILDQAAEAIVVCNPNGQVVVANQVAQRLSGISPLHRPFLEVFPLRLGRGEVPWHSVERRQAPRFGPAVTLDSICSGSSVQRVEVNLPRRDGFKFHLLLSAGPLLGAQGKPLGCIITLTDITQLRLAEAALREGEDRFIRFIHSDLLGILVAEEDSIREANDTFLQMVGRTRAELGLDWRAVISSEQHLLVEQKLKQLLDAGVTGPFELDYVHPANGRIPVLISLILLEASPLRWVGFVVNQEERERANAALDFQVQERTAELSETNQVLETEVAERRRVEEELRHSRALFESLLESAPDAIIAVDHAGRIVLVNSQTDEMFGYRRDELLGQTVELLLPTRFRDIHVAHRTNYGRAPSTRPMGVGLDLWGRRKDGTEFPVEISLSPIRSDNSSLIVSIIRDVTARKETQEQIRELNVELERRVRELAAVNQELEAFSYSVSHDLRAPLRAIAGFSQALSEDYDATLDEQGKDYTRRIDAATQRLTQLIDDLLMLSRVTRSEMNRETTVDLSALANSIASQLQSAQPERRVQFVVQPGLVTHGDAHLLHIALDNLIGNAWKFTSKTPEPRIEFGTTGKENGKTAYFVRDNGAGFDMAFATKLFGPFQRLHSGNEFPGTGIGLATVQRIVHRHGGRVWAEGEVGRGATVYFTL
jgi:PAS domain S-box-containing protein